MWSSVFFGFALLVSGVAFAPEAFGFVSAMVALAIGGLWLSTWWENAGNTVHLTVLLASVVLIVGVVFCAWNGLLGNKLENYGNHN